MKTNATYSRLLDVAIEHFGRFGLSGASTRAIAGEAGTPMSAITYHFGGKDGLYLASARHIGAQMAERLAPAAADAGHAHTDDADRQSARQALHAIYAHVATVLTGIETASLARFIVPEQADPTEAFTIIYDDMMSPLLDRITGLLKAVARGKLEDREARLRAVALMGQVLVFRVARATVLRATGWTDIGPDEQELIRRIIAEHLDAVLDRLVRSCQ
jgi:AcrR family transcriptional regulator